MTHPPFDFPLEDADDVTMDAFRAFKRAMMLHRRLLMSTFAEEPLHPAQAGCLQALAHRDGIGQSDLAEMLHVSRPTVTTMLKRMETSGLIERRADEADSRITRVYLTDEGHRLAEVMRKGFAELLNTSVGWLPPGDKRELSRILNGLNDHVEAVLKERGIGAWVHPHPRNEEGAAE